jgi:Tfp pilus assembly protein PilF
VLDPNMLAARVNLGALLRKAGEHQAAAEEYRAALRIQPDCEQAHYNLACVLSR